MSAPSLAAASGSGLRQSAPPSKPETASNLRFRQAFTYEDLDCDYNDQVLFMDEQSQEELIGKLRSDDLRHNRYYSVALQLITAAGIPYFLIRYCFISSKGWIWNSDLFFMLSLGISYRCIPKPMARSEGDTSLVSLGYPWLQWQKMNIVWSCVMCLWTWLKMFSLGIGEKPGHHEEYLCAIPFLVALLGWAMRKMMEAVNFEQLEHLRYEYKGA